MLLLAQIRKQLAAMPPPDPKQPRRQPRERWRARKNAAN
jgi:hypothetical protein